MVAELEKHRGALANLCRRFGVRRLEAFGAASSAGPDVERDEYEFLVELEPPEGTSRFDAFFGLKEEMERLLCRTVELVDPSALANPYLAELVEDTRQELYRTGLPS